MGEESLQIGVALLPTFQNCHTYVRRLLAKNFDGHAMPNLCLYRRETNSEQNDMPI